MSTTSVKAAVKTALNDGYVTKSEINEIIWQAVKDGTRAKPVAKGEAKAVRAMVEDSYYSLAGDAFTRSMDFFDRFQLKKPAIPASTEAVGEEDGGFSTMAGGEEDGRVTTFGPAGEEDGGSVSTQALGEEDGGFSTMAGGEEDGGFSASTEAVGEEDGGFSTMAGGEEDGGFSASTEAVGEEDGGFSATTAAIGEEA